MVHGSPTTSSASTADVKVSRSVGTAVRLNLTKLEQRTIHLLRWRKKIEVGLSLDSAQGNDIYVFSLRSPFICLRPPTPSPAFIHWLERNAIIKPAKRQRHPA